jgi:hypothetical protein
LKAPVSSHASIRAHVVVRGGVQRRLLAVTITGYRLGAVGPPTDEEVISWVLNRRILWKSQVSYRATSTLFSAVVFPRPNSRRRGTEQPLAGTASIRQKRGTGGPPSHQRFVVGACRRSFGAEDALGVPSPERFPVFNTSTAGFTEGHIGWRL